MKKLLIYLVPLLFSVVSYGQTKQDTTINKNVSATSSAAVVNKTLNPVLHEILGNRVTNYGSKTLLNEIITYTGIKVKFGNSAEIGPLSGSDTLTAPDADPLNFRIDLLVVNRNGTTEIITGDPGEQGIDPSYDVANQIPVWRITVNDRGIGTVTPVTFATQSEANAGILTNVAMSPNTTVTLIDLKIDEALAGIMAGGSGGHIIQNAYDNLPTRKYLNFLGENNSVVVVDENDSTTTIAIAGYPVNSGNIVYVSPDGNDGTGQRGDRSHPFQTADYALAAASAGDLLYFLPGTYSLVGLYIKDLNVYFAPGAIVQSFFVGYGGSGSQRLQYRIFGGKFNNVVFYGNIHYTAVMEGATITGQVVVQAFPGGSTSQTIPDSVTIRNSRIDYAGSAIAALRFYPSYSNAGNYKYFALDLDHVIIHSVNTDAMFIGDIYDTARTTTVRMKYCELIADDASKLAINNIENTLFYLAYNQKNRAHGGSQAVVNQLASTMGDGFSVGISGGGGSGGDADSLISIPGNQFVTLTGTQTLANKTFTSPVINSGSLGSNTVANTPSAGDNSTKVGTTAYTDRAVQSGASTYAVVSGTDTYTASLTPALTAYAAGQTFRLLFTNANTTTATLNINSVGAIALKKSGGAALIAGDIVASTIYIATYDGTSFQLNIGNIGQWYDYVPTFAGWSTPPTVTVARYCLIGKLCTVYIRATAGGTSNATTATVTLPFATPNIATSQATAFMMAINNGSIVTTTMPTIQTKVNSNIADLFLSPAGLAWTATGGKGIAVGSFSYEIQ